MKTPVLDRTAVLRLAELAQLRVDEAEVEGLARDLARIVAYAGELADVDVTGVAPMERPAADGEAIARPDEPGAELPRDELLAGAPRVEDGGFAVPPFVDEG